jgi:hypothetical protein
MEAAAQGSSRSGAEERRFEASGHVGMAGECRAYSCRHGAAVDLVHDCSTF